MERATITQQDIDSFLAERARLAPLAAMLGLSYDPDDLRLTNALETIYARRQHAGSPPSAGDSSASASALGAQTALALSVLERFDAEREQRRNGARATPDDLGAAVVDVLRRRRGLAPLREGNR